MSPHDLPSLNFCGRLTSSHTGPFLISRDGWCLGIKYDRIKENKEIRNLNENDYILIRNSVNIKLYNSRTACRKFTRFYVSFSHTRTHIRYSLVLINLFATYPGITRRCCWLALYPTSQAYGAWTVPSKRHWVLPIIMARPTINHPRTKQLHSQKQFE